MRVLKMSMFTKDPFDSDGSIPLSDRYRCENGLLPFLKRPFVGDNGMEPSALLVFGTWLEPLSSTRTVTW